jgi:hypothetical protein
MVVVAVAEPPAADQLAARRGRRHSVCMWSLIPIFLGMLLVACASAAGAIAPSAGAAEGGAAGSTVSASGGLELGGASVGPAADLGGGDGGGARANDFAECATSTAKSQLEPVYLVFLLDQSASMGDGVRPQKWDPVTQALQAFFADIASTGLYASLTLFPNDANPTSATFGSSDFAIRCDADAYFAPAVEARPLPEASAFASAIAAVDPPNEWGTPTTAALAGTVRYAKALAAQGKKVAIVMVTDGEPAQCDATTNSVATTVEVAAGVAGTIPTYVIGVGSELNGLDKIAEAGGTESAFIVDIADPGQTRSEFLARVRAIQSEQISCELELPAAPPGMLLDPTKVNVELSADGPARIVEYDETCASHAGWHYDDSAAPHSISLCDESCKAAQSAGAAALNVIFGCETRRAPVR